MDKKYELTTETKKMPNGDVVYRIKALRSFNTIIGREVKEGDIGGWVSSESNLVHYGNCWLFDEAVNSGNSRRTENSVGYDNAWSYGNSLQTGNSRQSENSCQTGNSRQFNNSRQSGNSCQTGNSRQFNNSCQTGNSLQYGNSCQTSNSRQRGDSIHVIGVDSGNNEIITIGYFGEYARYVTLQPDDSVCCGCFHGTFDEFVSAVKRKYGPTYETYSMCIAILRVIIKERGNQSKE